MFYFFICPQTHFCQKNTPPTAETPAGAHTLESLLSEFYIFFYKDILDKTFTCQTQKINNTNYQLLQADSVFMNDLLNFRQI